MKVKLYFLELEDHGLALIMKERTFPIPEDVDHRTRIAIETARKQQDVEVINFLAPKRKGCINETVEVVTAANYLPENICQHKKSRQEDSGNYQMIYPLV